MYGHPSWARVCLLHTYLEGGDDAEEVEDDKLEGARSKGEEDQGPGQAKDRTEAQQGQHVGHLACGRSRRICTTMVPSMAVLNRNTRLKRPRLVTWLTKESRIQHLWASVQRLRVAAAHMVLPGPWASTMVSPSYRAVTLDTTDSRAKKSLFFPTILYSFSTVKRKAQFGANVFLTLLTLASLPFQKESDLGSPLSSRILVAGLSCSFHDFSLFMTSRIFSSFPIYV